MSKNISYGVPPLVETVASQNVMLVRYNGFHHIMTQFYEDVNKNVGVICKPNLY